MYIYQYILIAAFICLFLNKDLRLASASFLFGWAVYCVIVLSLGAGSYYALSATIELLIGWSLIRRYKIVSYLSFFLILVNFYGLWLYKNGMSADSYDIIYCIISIFQVLTLITRGLVNGSAKLYNKRALVFLVNFDGNQNRAKMQKRIQE